MVDTGRLKTDLFALVVLAAAVFIGLSLASFDPADPPARSVYPVRTQPANLCGEIGATLSGELFTNFGHGGSHSFGGEYLELVPNEKIRYTDRFDDPNLPGTITVTVALKPVVCGTELTIVQEGLPDVIPVEMCYLGWQESLVQLARLVDPEIRDE